MNYILLFSPLGDKITTGIVTPDGTIGDNLGRYLNGVKVYDFAAVMRTLASERLSISADDLTNAKTGVRLFTLDQDGFSDAFRALKARGRSLDQLLLIGDALHFHNPEPL
jgi:hypothetical protein